MIPNGMSIASASHEVGGAKGHRVSDASVRGGLYKVFSHAFLYPSPEVGDLFRDPELPEVLAGLVARSGEEASVERAIVRELSAYLRSAEFQGEHLGSAYHALFHLGEGVSLYESPYRGAHEFQWAETLADVSGFYRAFGVEPIGERPDHLSVELEFMYVLALKEMRARPEDESFHVTRGAERAFLRDHLAVWVPALAQAVRRRVGEIGAGEEGFYVRMLAWLERFLASECARLDVTPVTTAPVPESSREEEEEFTCPSDISGGEGRTERIAALRRWEVPEGREER
jgi:TorA maturation chaperone TorD